MASPTDGRTDRLVPYAAWFAAGRHLGHSLSYDRARSDLHATTRGASQEQPLHRLRPIDQRIDVAEFLSRERGPVSTRRGPRGAPDEQLTDLRQRKARMPCKIDRCERGEDVFAIAAPSVHARRLSEESGRLVVADRRRAKTCPSRYLPDG